MNDRIRFAIIGTGNTAIPGYVQISQEFRDKCYPTHAT